MRELQGELRGITARVWEVFAARAGPLCLGCSGVVYQSSMPSPCLAMPAHSYTYCSLSPTPPLPTPHLPDTHAITPTHTYLTHPIARHHHHHHHPQAEEGEHVMALSGGEREELLGHLKAKWATLNAAFQALPFTTDTPAKARRKEALEAQLAQAEADIKSLAHGGTVYVVLDM